MGMLSRHRTGYANMLADHGTETREAGYSPPQQEEVMSSTQQLMLPAHPYDAPEEGFSASLKVSDCLISLSAASCNAKMSPPGPPIQCADFVTSDCCTCKVIRIPHRIVLCKSSAT